MADQKDLGGGLKTRIDRRDGATVIALSGGISEATNLSPLLDLPNPLRFELEGIDRINSLGVRNWVTFVRDAEAKGMQLTFERCSPVLVSQMGMISNFMGTSSRVKSLFVVYVCPSCNAEHLQLTDVEYGKPLQVSTSMA